MDNNKQFLSMRRYPGTTVIFIAYKVDDEYYFVNENDALYEYKEEEIANIGFCAKLKRIPSFVFSYDDEEFVFMPDEEEDTDDEDDYPYFDDETDYDRDTYYALGGDDYDRFRENGGSIDNMMDGMGL